MMNSNKLLSIEDLAEYLGIPKRTLYAWRYRGEGPIGYRLGGCIRFRPTDVEEWLSNHREGESPNG